MADYQRIVEYLRDVRGSLGSGSIIVTDELRNAATSYAELCSSANERLRQCSAFLAQGLRSEAIHLADENPNLLDMVAALDLPDQNVWAEWCQLNELPVPPMLQMDRAQQLNEAYAADQPMEALLTRHRLLALSRAPVRDRLDVLRQIHAVDPGNQNWDKDVRVFEKARLKQLPAVFYAAAKKKDVASLVALQTEVNGNTWLEAPPSDLSTALAEAFRRIQRADVDTQLRGLVEPLRQAFGARDVQQCTEMVARWRAIMEAGEVTTCASDLAHEVQPVVEWLKQEEELRAHRKRFDRSCDALTQLLDSNANEHDLEAAYARAAAFNEPIPAELQQRYDARQEAIQKTQAQSHRMRLIYIAAAVVVILSLAGGGAWFLMQQGKSKQWAQRIEAAVMEANTDVTKVQAARDLVNEQEKAAPNLSSDALIKAARTKVDELFRRKANQEAELNKEVVLLTSAIKEAKEALGKSPEKVIAASNNARDALGAASADLTWLDKPTNTLPPLKDQLSSVQSQLAAEANSAILDQALKLESEISAVNSSAGMTIESANASLAALGDLNSKINRLRIVGIDARTKGELDRLAEVISQKRASLGASNEVASAMQAIVDASVSADQLKQAMDAFNARYGESELAGDFRIAIKAIPAAKAMEALKTMQRPWLALSANNALRFFPQSGLEEIGKVRSAEIQNYLKNHPASPLAGPLNFYTDYFRRMGDALAEKDPAWNMGYGEILNTPLVSRLSYVETINTITKKTTRYFVLEQPKFNPTSVNEQRVIEFKIMNPNNITDTKNQQIKVPEELVDGGKMKLTPHAAFVQKLQVDLRAISASNWDTIGIDTVDAIMKDPAMQPIVRGLLIAKTLEAQNAVLGPYAPTEYAPVLAAIRRQQLEKLEFFKQDVDFSKETNLISGTLAELAKIDARKGLADKKASLAAVLYFQPEFTGVLFRDSGNFRIESKGTPRDGMIARAVKAGEPPADAPAAAPAPAEGAAAAPATPTVAPGELMPIATFKGGKWEFAPDAPRDLPSGTMIFISAP